MLLIHTDARTTPVFQARTFRSSEPSGEVSADFLRRIFATVPYMVHTFLTGNGAQLTTQGAGGSARARIRAAIAAAEIFRAPAFELACARVVLTIAPTSHVPPRRMVRLSV